MMHAMEKAEVVEFLCRVVGDIVENETGRRPAVAETSNLWGQNGLLSSLMLVELMLAVEDFCAEQGKNFSWTSDSTVSEQRSAYRSVASLADVILTMPDAAASREGA